jgi:sigma-E factor negative regulatory protein RseA
MAIDGFDDSAKERLSALADGELDPAGSVASCAAWSQDAALRVEWHAWHLIGDVLRSEDLASDPRHDRDFCAALRSRLRGEPIVLAPAPALAGPATAPLDRRTRPGRWSAAGAVAAGFVLVVGTFAVLRPGESPAPTQIARNDGPGATTAPVVAAAPAAEPAAQPVAIVADSKIIRDAQLERYLEAHKQFAGTSALGVPSAFLRSATVDSAAR